MSIPSLILTILATLSPPDAPPDKDDQPKGPKAIKDQHFCCAETWNDGAKHGDDCETIDKSDIKTCRIGGGAVLYCSGSWDQDTGGTVTCG